MPCSDDCICQMIAPQLRTALGESGAGEGPPTRVEALDQLVKRIREQLDTFALQLQCDRVHVDADRLQLLHDAPRALECLWRVHRARYATMVLEGLQRSRRYGIDRKRPDQLLDVH